MTIAMSSATERPIVIGKPRSSRAGQERFGWSSGCRAAIATPTARGTTTASAIHTMRMIHAGTDSGMGTNASTNVAKRGAMMPRSRRGQAPAAASNAERKIFCVPVVYPKIATTAQSKSALRIRPNERPTNAISACTIAMTLDAAARDVPRAAAHSNPHRCRRPAAPHRHGAGIRVKTTR